MERKLPDKKTSLGIMVSLLGIIIMTLEFPMKANIGDLMVFLGTVGFSVQIYTLGKHGKETDPLLLTNIILWIVGLITFAISIGKGQFQVPVTPALIVQFVYIIVLCTAWGLYVQNKYQPDVDTSHAAIIFLMLLSVLFY